MADDDLYAPNPFVPFTYSELDSALRLEVQADDDDLDMLTCRLVVIYRADRYVFTFAVLMLRRMFHAARASHWDRSGTIPLEPRDPEYFLRVHRPMRGEDWQEWADLDLTRTRRAGKSRRPDDRSSDQPRDDASTI